MDTEHTEKSTEYHGNNTSLLFLPRGIRSPFPRIPCPRVVANRALGVAK
jgi:hypothetical protein